MMLREELCDVLRDAGLQGKVAVGRRPPSGGDWLIAREFFNDGDERRAILRVCQQIASSPHHPTHQLWTLPGGFGTEIEVDGVSLKLERLPDDGRWVATAYFAWGAEVPA